MSHHHHRDDHHHIEDAVLGVIVGSMLRHRRRRRDDPEAIDLVSGMDVFYAWCLGMLLFVVIVAVLFLTVK